jgi:hypothetical protein
MYRMTPHPLRKFLLARKHPAGLQAARRELAEILECNPDSVRNVDSALKRPGWPFAIRIQDGTAKIAAQHPGLVAVKAEKLMRAPVRDQDTRSRAA